MDLFEQFISRPYAQRIALSNHQLSNATNDSSHLHKTMPYWEHLSGICSHLRHGYRYGSNDTYVPSVVLEKSYPPETARSARFAWKKDAIIDISQARPNGSLHTIYSSLWKASIQLTDIGLLCPIGDLGSDVFRPFSDAFGEKLFYKTHEVAEPISANATSQCILAKPVTPLDKKNYKSLMENDTPWLKLLNGYDLGYFRTGSQVGESLRFQPQGTLVGGEGPGGIVAYPFLINSTLLLPLYGGMVRTLRAILIANQFSSCLFLVHQSHGRSRPLKELRSAVSACLAILNTALPLRPHSSNPSCDNNRRKLLLLGHSINYGHTLINESSVLYLACKFAKSLQSSHIFPIIGDYDFLSAASLLTNYYEPHKIAYLNAFKILHSPGFYYVPFATLVPGSSKLPTSECLEFVARGAEHVHSHQHATFRPGINSQVNLDSFSVYLSPGGRRGTPRDFANILEVIAHLSKLTFVKAIILDGLTAFPRYISHGSDDSSAVETIIETPSPCLQSPESSQLRAVAQENSTKLVIIDGMTFIEKIAACRDHLILCAIVPYGSPAMFPIYALNVETILVGHEAFGKLVEHWKWHVTRLCHPRREMEERYCPSLLSGSGFKVDISHLISEVKSLRRAWPIKSSQDIWKNRNM